MGMGGSQSIKHSAEHGDGHRVKEKDNNVH